MKKDESTKPVQPPEHEGSYSATRRYNQHLGDAVTSGDLEADAEEARRATEGSEGKERGYAAEEAKKGPKDATAKVPSGGPKVQG